MPEHATSIDYVGVHDDGGDGAFVVIAKVGDHWFHHEGPKGYSHFTYEQAKRLEERVKAVGSIDLEHWTSSQVTEDELEERWLIDALERR